MITSSLIFYDPYYKTSIITIETIKIITYERSMTFDNESKDLCFS